MQVVNLMKVVPKNARRDTTNDSLSICIIAEGFPRKKDRGCRHLYLQYRAGFGEEGASRPGDNKRLGR